jgi:SAM-dependent methyltransferase
MRIALNVPVSLWRAPDFDLELAGGRHELPNDDVKLPAALVRCIGAAAGAGVVEIVEADAREFPLSAEAWDVALCLGATFVWHDLAGTLAALVPAVRPGGHVAVGEPYWREPPPGEEDLGYVDLAQTVRRFESGGLVTVGLVGASSDDWDRYESLHWRAVESWLAEHPDSPDASELRRANDQHRREYVEVRRDRLGWMLLAGLKPG